jgi:hypothetical protein
VSPVAMLCLVLLAAFGLVTLLFSSLIALAWRAGLDRKLATSADLLALRLLPAAGGLLIALTVVLPAFLSFEPHRERETGGPLFLALAALSLAVLAHGISRGLRACLAARRLLRNYATAGRCVIENGQAIHVLDIPEPITAVVGGWHPRIVAAECVVSACSQSEFRQVIAHEAAHVTARDNLKLLLLVATPDPIAWLPVGAALIRRWRAVAEVEADQRATGNDARSRVALASALIKVARLFKPVQDAQPRLSMSAAADDVAGRVRRLLAPPDALPATIVKRLAPLALLTPVLAMPLYALIHELLEVLIRLGL